MQLEFNNISLDVRPHPQFDWGLTGREVALGYGVSEGVIRRHKQNHADELIERKHWVVQKMNTPGGAQQVTYWTKRGIVRLGFFVKSEQAKKFRDWAEDLVISLNEASTVQTVTRYTMPGTYAEALRLLADSVEHNAQLTSQLALAEPVLDYYDRVRESDNTCDMAMLAEKLAWPNIGRNNLIKFLRERHVFVQKFNRPYQEYIENGWFKVVEVNTAKPGQVPKIFHKTVAFQKGVEGVHKLLKKHKPLSAIIKS